MKLSEGGGFSVRIWLKEVEKNPPDCERGKRVKS